MQDAGDIPVDSSHFPDESFRSWILNPGNLNGAGSDAVLTAEERSAVTEINVSGQNIADLTGIGHFSSLLVLNCSKNSLTSLDLSQNALLEELSCSSNRLTALDLSSNPNLKSVYCASNRLTSLNVTGCARLQSLNCEKNYLTSLDLSGNPELIQLYSRHNQLTQLDVSRNTKLKFIETFDNQLTSFDCTMLPDLEFLHIDYNKLTTLDMSQNPKLQGNGFVAANNQLDELTLPNLPGMSIEASVFYEQNPRTGYDTVRWFYDSSYSQEIAEGDRVEANGRKIYAKWIANPYTVYYNANGGHGSIPPQAVEYDQTFRLSPNTFTRTGYTFLNWNTYPDAVGGRTFTDGQEVVNLTGASSNRDRVTLYAVWRSQAEIQQQYQDQLTDFFRAFQTNSYYPEDWASLQSIRRVASETVAQSGGDESAMQTALETAYAEARNVSTKEQRAQAIAQSWRTAHSGILSQISVPVALDRLEETSLLAQAAVADAGTEWLAQQSTLTDPASRQDAARAAQNKLATEVQQLQSMQHAIVWLGSVKDAYQVPLSSVTSADAAQYAASVNAYAALSSQEKAYCTPGVADQLTVRRNLAQEKQSAIRNLDTYFASLNWTDYTEANQKKLEQIAAETKTAIESADTAGAADRLFLEGVDRFKEVGTIVRQKTPVIEVKPTASAITKGQKLSDSQLIGGKADAEGTFA